MKARTRAAKPLDAEAKSSSSGENEFKREVQPDSGKVCVTVGRWHGRTFPVKNPVTGKTVNIVLTGNPDEAAELAREARQNLRESGEAPKTEEPLPEMPNFMELMWTLYNPFLVRVRVSDKAYILYTALIASCGDIRKAKPDEDGNFWVELNPWPNRSGRRFTPTLQELADFLPGRSKPFESPFPTTGKRTSKWIESGANERTVRLVLDELEEHRLVTREMVGRFKDGKRNGTALKFRVQVPKALVEAAGIGRPQRDSRTENSALNSTSPDRNSTSPDRKPSSGCSTSRHFKTLKTLSVQGASDDLVAAKAAEEPSGKAFSDAELRRELEAQVPSAEACRQAMRRPEAVGGREAVADACKRWAIAEWQGQNPDKAGSTPIDLELQPLMRWLVEPIRGEIGVPVDAGNPLRAAGDAQGVVSLTAALVRFGVEEPARRQVMRRKSPREIMECIARCEAAGLGAGYLVEWSKGRKPLPTLHAKPMRLSAR